MDKSQDLGTEASEQDEVFNDEQGQAGEGESPRPTEEPQEGGVNDEAEASTDEANTPGEPSAGTPEGRGAPDVSGAEKTGKEAVAVAGDLKAENEALAAQLQNALVRLDGRLADPADLPFNRAFIDDPEALDQAIADLVRRKPGLKARQVAGNIGQGKRGSAAKPAPNLIEILKQL